MEKGFKRIGRSFTNRLASSRAISQWKAATPGLFLPFDDKWLAVRATGIRQALGSQSKHMFMI